MVEEYQMVKTRVRRPVTEDEERRVVNYLLEGRNPYQIGKIMGRDRGSIIRIAQRREVELSQEVLERLKPRDTSFADGITAYTRFLKSQTRQETLSFAMSKVELMLRRDNIPAKDVRDLTVSLGIIVDKFAVENGKTSDTAKAELIALFQQIEVNATTGTSREAGEIHS